MKLKQYVSDVGGTIVVELFEQLKSKINGQNKTIVFPEGEDVRIQGAAARLAAEGSIKPILLGDERVIATTASENNFDLSVLKSLIHCNMMLTHWQN